MCPRFVFTLRILGGRTMLKAEVWLQILELVKLLSFPVYREDREDTIQENLVYVVERFIFEGKRPGRRKNITPKYVLQKIKNRVRIRKDRYRRGWR